MKIILVVFGLLMLAGMASAMTNNQTSYLAGVQDGWSLCYLRLSDIDAYNIEVQKYNDDLNQSLNATEAASQWLAFAEQTEIYLPEIFR
jgi:hypothetical protein